MTEKEQLVILEDWLHLHKGLIFKIVRVYTGTIMDQDDLFQEIIVQVWQSIPAFRQACSVTTWLYRIALNTAIKWTKKTQKHQQAEPLEKVQHILQANTVQSDDRLEWLYREIHQLDPVDRSLALLLLEGFSYKEMADTLGITTSNIGVKINRIKQQLIDKSKNYNHHGI